MKKNKVIEDLVYPPCTGTIKNCATCGNRFLPFPTCYSGEKEAVMARNEVIREIEKNTKGLDFKGDKAQVTVLRIFNNLQRQ